tara:strand:+ start:4813 stop:5034 length:222 start_codon:yes stop_codon:yes gene_type:complete
MEKMTKREYNLYKSVRENKKLTPAAQDVIAELHSKYYNHQFFKPCSCSGKTWKQWIAQLNDIWDNGYKDSTSA